MRNAFVRSLSHGADQNPNLMLISGDLGFGALEPFIAKHPEKFINAGVAEQNMVGIAAGMATCGFKVFIYSIANFPLMRCLEQIRNDVCYHNLDVTIVAVGAGFTYGAQGYTHHAIEDIGVMRCMNRMQIFSPSDPTETNYATSCCLQTSGPKYLRLGRAGDEVVFNEKIQLSPSGLNFVHKDDHPTLILCTGSVLVEAIEAHILLAQKQHPCDVASLMKLQPLETEYLSKALSKYQQILVVEEHIDRGGLLDCIFALLSKEDNRPQILAININSQAQFGAIGNQPYLRAVNGMSAEAIAGTILTAAHHET